MTSDAQEKLRHAEERISFVLTHPGISPWLRDTVKRALERDPVDVLNDMEILDNALRFRCEAMRQMRIDELESQNQDRGYAAPGSTDTRDRLDENAAKTIIARHTDTA